MLSPLKVPGESIMLWGILGCDAPQAQGEQAGKGLFRSGCRIQDFCTISGLPLQKQETGQKGKEGLCPTGVEMFLCGQSLTQNVIRGGDKRKEKEEKNKKGNRMDRYSEHTPKHPSPVLTGPPSGLTISPVLTCTKESCWYHVLKEKCSRPGV